MARVKRAVNAHKKRRSTLEAASGYRGQRSRLYRKAKEQLLHSATYQYRDRKARKGDFRQLWITRINAAARANDITYNRLIQGLRLAGVSGALADEYVVQSKAGDYSDLLRVACERLDVAPLPPGDLVPQAEIYRAEAALRQRGLDVRETASR